MKAWYENELISNGEMVSFRWLFDVYSFFLPLLFLNSTVFLFDLHLKSVCFVYNQQVICRCLLVNSMLLAVVFTTMLSA